MLFFVYSIVALIIYLYFYIERMSFMEKIINWLRIVLAEEKSSKWLAEQLGADRATVPK